MRSGNQIRRTCTALQRNVRMMQVHNSTNISGFPVYLRLPHHANFSAMTPQAASTATRWYLAPLLISTLGLGAAAEFIKCEAPQSHVDQAEEQEVVNWSGTHSVSTTRYFQPESVDELKQIISDAHRNKKKLRPIGSALSPNGLGLEQGGMVNLVMLDKVLDINVDKKQVKVQAGVTVDQLVKALRPHGLTLQNFASITEQQIGGFTQVGAHGTGVNIPPVDEQVVAMKLITPAVGEVDLSIDDDDPSLFQLARTSLGLLGVVAEVTLQCVPAHRLVEKTIVMDKNELWDKHSDLMKRNVHLRYMWIPYTDSVVVVTCNPLGSKLDDGVVVEDNKYTMDQRLEATRKLLQDHPACKFTEKQIMGLKFTALRDELLALDPLNAKWVKKVNQAEADFWKKSEGTRIDWSDRILQFDCGGQQWVSEVSFPVSKDGKARQDLQYVKNLMDLIEEENIPAHSPIEQRWTAPSYSPMSPAGEKPDKELPWTYSWVGIIMYLPDASTDMMVRTKITESFKSYKRLCEKHLWSDARAVEHWAKIEMPASAEEKALLQLRTYQKYPVEAFKEICNLFDPHGILRNDLMDTILGADTKTSILEATSTSA